MKPLLLTIFFLLPFSSVFSLTIDQQLMDKTLLEQAQIKSLKIVEATTTPVYLVGDIVVQMMTVPKIVTLNGLVGVEVYARAWKGAEPYGFVDGTVEIEHFRFWNPRVLVPDDLGSIVREIKNFNKAPTTRKFREDPATALQLQLAEKIKATGKLSTKIVLGKKGNTTDTCYPAAGANDPVDGRVQRGGVTESWATIHAATGNGTNVTGGGSQNHVALYGDGTNWNFLYRSIFGCNTSFIGTDTVSSATFTLHAEGNDGTAYSQSVILDRKVPASASTLANGDFDVGGWAGVKQSDTTFSVATWGTGGTAKDFPLNATGIANLSTSGDSWLGTRTSSDFDNSEPTNSNSSSDALTDYADTVGTTVDPSLTVVHAAASTPSQVNRQDIISFQ